MAHILILGGGASGLAAALAAAQAGPAGTRITVLERGPRVGRKLLATGNGRCNISNADLSPQHYFTSDPAALALCLETVQNADPLGWLGRLGLLCAAPDEAGRIYPYSNQAQDVLDLLLDRLTRAGVSLQTGVQVVGLRQQRSGWAVACAEGRPWNADAVICALGGSAGPQFGTDGFGPALAKNCGMQVEPLYPCLVPLQCGGVDGTLAGLRARGTVSLFDGGRFVAAERGEIQFTGYGLSGIAVMQLSGLLRPRESLRAPELRLDLFPAWETTALAALLQTRAETVPELTAAQTMTGLISKRIGLAVWKSASLGSETRPAAGLRPEEWRTLAHTFKSWRFPVTGPLGWKQAQTTGGGLALGEIEPDTFALRGCRGLYFVGETLDCAGTCGGYNLHWAFGTGLAAGRAAAQRAARAQPRKKHAT